MGKSNNKHISNDVKHTLGYEGWTAWNLRLGKKRDGYSKLVPGSRRKLSMVACVDKVL